MHSIVSKLLLILYHQYVMLHLVDALHQGCQAQSHRGLYDDISGFFLPLGRQSGRGLHEPDAACGPQV